MYHMNLVRDNFASKFANTSTTNDQFLSQVERGIRDWKEGAAFRFGTKGVFEFERVENEFCTFDPEE